MSHYAEHKIADFKDEITTSIKKAHENGTVTVPFPVNVICFNLMEFLLKKDETHEFETLVRFYAGIHNLNPGGDAQLGFKDIKVNMLIKQNDNSIKSHNCNYTMDYEFGFIWFDEYSDQDKFVKYLFSKGIYHHAILMK